MNKVKSFFRAEIVAFKKSADISNIHDKIYFFQVPKAS